MSTQGLVQNAVSVLVADETLADVIRALGLQAAEHPIGPRARFIRKRANASPIAAILEQGETFREDKRAILAMKSASRELPIIFIARTTQPRREMAIRRLCIHYFLADPADSEELRLVLDALLRASVSTTSYERFFTR